MTLLGLPLAFGTSSNCPTATGTTLATINGDTNGLTTGGATVSTSGCGAVDETFGNIGISGFTTTGGSSAFSTATDGFTTANSIAQDFTIAGGASDATAGFGTTRTDTGDLFYLTQFGTSSGVKPVTSGVDVVEVVLSGVDIPDVATGGHDASIAVTISVCEGATSAPTATFSTCTGVGGTLETSTLTITNTSATAAITGSLEFFLALPTNTSVLAVNDTITLVSNSNGATSFTGFGEDFETPEPSTFVLLGAALGALGLLRWRLRRGKSIGTIESSPAL